MNRRGKYWTPDKHRQKKAEEKRARRRIRNVMLFMSSERR